MQIGCPCSLRSCPAASLPPCQDPGATALERCSLSPAASGTIWVHTSPEKPALNFNIFNHFRRAFPGSSPCRTRADPLQNRMSDPAPRASYQDSFPITLEGCSRSPAASRIKCCISNASVDTCQTSTSNLNVQFHLPSAHPESSHNHTREQLMNTSSRPHWVPCTKCCRVKLIRILWYFIPSNSALSQYIAIEQQVFACQLAGVSMMASSEPATIAQTANAHSPPPFNPRRLDRSQQPAHLSVAPSSMQRMCRGYSVAGNEALACWMNRTTSAIVAGSRTAVIWTPSSRQATKPAALLQYIGTAYTDAGPGSASRRTSHLPEVSWKGTSPGATDRSMVLFKRPGRQQHHSQPCAERHHVDGKASLPCALCLMS